MQNAKNLHRTDSINGHKWVNYNNPRNGRIQVTACKSCGTMLAGALASRPCIPKHEKNPIESRGWVIQTQALEAAT